VVVEREKERRGLCVSLSCSARALGAMTERVRAQRCRPAIDAREEVLFSLCLSHGEKESCRFQKEAKAVSLSLTQAHARLLITKGV